MKNLSEYNSIEELENKLDVLEKKFKNRTLSMWASLPVAAIFVVTSIVGFGLGLSLLAGLSCGLAALGFISAFSNLFLAYKCSNMQDDINSEIHKRELTQTMKKLAKQNQKTNETNVVVEKGKVSNKHLNKTNNSNNDFTY